MTPDEFKDYCLTMMPHLVEKVNEDPKPKGVRTYRTESATYTDAGGNVWMIYGKFTLWTDGYVEFFFHAMRTKKKQQKNWGAFVHPKDSYFQKSSPFDEKAYDAPEYKGSGYKFQIIRTWF
jgi:hypothetical protein